MARGKHSAYVISNIRLATVGRVLLLLVFLLSLLGSSTFTVQAATPVAFTGEELLGKPTDTSITINIVPATTMEYHYQYGTSPGLYTEQTPNWTATGGQPHEVVISDLIPNTQYFYRMRYHLPGEGETDWVERPEYSFWTQRAPGSTFVFTVISDTHAEFTDAEYKLAVQHVIADQPDFHFDLGDTFMTDYDTTQAQVDAEYLVARNPLYMGGIGHSAPIFLASGNHENEEGWNLDDAFSIARASIQARKTYYPTPIEDGFYTGNLDPLNTIDEGIYGDKLREDYYAWEWGDALFVVIDPFQYTMQNPYGSMAGEGGDDPVTGDRWNWTLGLEQFNWFRQTIEDSNARYKFVFAHHMLGGADNYVRGGAVPAHMFEWGGYNADGTTWGYDAERAGWGEVPIHQLMVENGVSAFFHGHDHQYAYEVRDGIVYQCVPKPSPGLDFNYYSESNPYTERVIGNSGHLRITVTPDEATVEYVRSNTTGVSHTYTIEPNDATSEEYTIEATAGENGIIAPSGAVTVMEGDNQSFSMTPAGGYQVGNVLVDGIPVGAVTSYEFTDVHANHTIHASFELIPPTQYTLTTAVSPAGGGTTDPTVGGHVYAEGTVVDVTAIAASGYQFLEWSGACTGTGACQVTMDADKSVTAGFAPESGVLGDVNGDGVANSTDALIVLSCDVGMDTSPFCPMNCGDANADGLVNSTDALIILSYDAGMTTPFAVGQPGCPSGVTPCQGCAP